MGQPLKVRTLTPEEYLAGELQSEIRHEYINGEVFAMAGASETHNRIALNIAFYLRAAARGGPCGVFINDMKLRIRGGERFYYPDIALCCDRSDREAYYKDRPCLIAEVLSSSTAKTDRREKWLVYREIPQLRYYLLVNSERPEVEYFRRAEEGGWELGRLEPGEVLKVECEGYRAELRFEELFEDVVW
jgi:Uma2 family endonuclease